MRLLEYEAKNLLRDCAVPIPNSEVFQVNHLPKSTPFPVVLKSQVPIGGRGKAGGIVVAHTNSEFLKTAQTLFATTIKKYVPSTLLVEELLAIDKEFYLSLTINRSRSCIELISHNEGGVEIESQQTKFFRRELPEKPAFSAVADELADYLTIPDKAFLLENILSGCFSCFTKNDCLLLEINPLILTKQGTLVAGDCKIIVDDAAMFRHPTWKFEETPANTHFVTLHQNGTVATIANGAGLAMATVDAVQARGMMPANFLDIGGTATTETIVYCFQQIMQFPHVTAIIINIFGGIVRCDVVAQAILDAKKEIPNLPNLSIRLTGNKSDEARVLLKSHHLPLYNTLEDCLEAIQ